MSRRTVAVVVVVVAAAAAQRADRPADRCQRVHGWLWLQAGAAGSEGSGGEAAGPTPATRVRPDRSRFSFRN